MHVGMEMRWLIGREALREVDPVLFRLLAAVEGGASLRSAAREAGISYRHGWGLLQCWRKELGAPLVKLERGRGASITELGRSLLWAERRAGGRLAPLIDSMAAELERELSGPLAGSLPVRMIASHDLAIGLLRDLFNAADGQRLNLQYRGSLDCVQALARGRCDIAGFHLPEAPLGHPVEALLSRHLHPDHFTAMHFASRAQGLMVAPGNPDAIHGIADLARDGITFVNRQPGSGTRLLFDLLLGEAGIESRQVRGYDVEEFTHQAVAAMVASGAATAGFGVEAAASSFDLDFVPLARERYLLAVRRTMPAPAWLEALEALMRGEALRNAIREFPGYDLAGIGTLANLGRGPQRAAPA
jgi:putative molybdopterin biosynthesis protein